MTSVVIWSEMGGDGRCPPVRALPRRVRHAGLDITVYSSDSKRSPGRLSRQGSPLLRWALVEAAWRLVRFNRRWQAIFESLARRRGRKRAIVAVARRLLGVMVSLMQRGETFKLAA